MSFSEFGLHSALLESLSNESFTDATDAQREIIPRIMQGESFIQLDAAVKGKSLTYLLPIINRIYNDDREDIRGARIVVLTSRRDRISQINATLKSLSHIEKNIRTGFIVSGRPYQPQMRLMRRPLDIMLATPGRLSDLFRNNKADFSNLELLIVDDFDGIQRKNQQGVCQALIDQAKDDCQVVFFSQYENDVEAIQSIASLPNVYGEGIAGSNQSSEAQHNKAAPAEAKTKKQPPAKAMQKQADAHTEISIDTSLMPYLNDGKTAGLIADDFTHKMAMLDQLLDENADTRCIVFTSTSKEAAALTENIINHGHDVQFAQSLSDIEDDCNIYVISDKALLQQPHADSFTLIHYDLPRQAGLFFKRLQCAPAEQVKLVQVMIQNRDYHAYKAIEKQMASTLEIKALPGLEALNPLLAPKQQRTQRSQGKDGNNQARKSNQNSSKKAANGRGQNNKGHNKQSQGKNSSKSSNGRNNKNQSSGQGRNNQPNNKQNKQQGKNNKPRRQHGRGNGGRGLGGAQARADFNQNDEWITPEKENDKPLSKHSNVVIQHKTKKKLLMND